MLRLTRVMFPSFICHTAWGVPPASGPLTEFQNLAIQRFIWLGNKCERGAVSFSEIFLFSSQAVQTLTCEMHGRPNFHCVLWVILVGISIHQNTKCLRMKSRLPRIRSAASFISFVRKDSEGVLEIRKLVAADARRWRLGHFRERIRLLTSAATAYVGGYSF